MFEIPPQLTQKYFAFHADDRRRLLTGVSHERRGHTIDLTEATCSTRFSSLGRTRVPGIVTERECHGNISIERFSSLLIG